MKSKFQKLENQLESRRENDEKKEGKKERRVSEKVVRLVVQPSKIVSLQTSSFKFYFCKTLAESLSAHLREEKIAPGLVQ